MFYPSTKSTALNLEVERLQDTLDSKKFSLIKSLKKDTLAQLHPLQIGSKVSVKNSTIQGFIKGIQFDILTNPLIILSKIKKDGTQSELCYPQQFNIDDIETYSA